MANQGRGYVGQDKKGQWFARTTITDEHGRRRNISRRAKDKSEAKLILKTLLRQLEDEGCKAGDYARLTFVDLADFYSAHYFKPAEYINGRQRSITTVNRESTYLRRSFNIAEREGFIDKNPFRSGDTLISTTDEVRREWVGGQARYLSSIFAPPSSDVPS